MLVLSVIAIGLYAVFCLLIVSFILSAVTTRALSALDSATRSGSETTGSSADVLFSRGKGVCRSNALPSGLVLPDDWWSE